MASLGEVLRKLVPARAAGVILAQKYWCTIRIFMRSVPVRGGSLGLGGPEALVAFERQIVQARVHDEILLAVRDDLRPTLQITL